ncbi:hypothetical protein [Pseudooceanicola sp.]|uniref:hypothetical protein n=1 Tax=Pseudooceanicola sp. TaxID=1914328 RepID=UPI00262EC7C8|nr:hypothetical protein [Pseudooceanicola sp.]MDF1853861.1 hypothetical protein [Pseudooceanicola sp.]
MNGKAEAAQKSHIAPFIPTLQTAGFAIGAAPFGWLSRLNGEALPLPILALWGGAGADRTVGGARVGAVAPIRPKKNGARLPPRRFKS